MNLDYDGYFQMVREIVAGRSDGNRNSFLFKYEANSLYGKK